MVKLHPLKLYLVKNQINHGNFARQIGINPVYLSMILQYKTFPSRQVALKIIELTRHKLTLNDLLLKPKMVKDNSEILNIENNNLEIEANNK